MLTRTFVHLPRVGYQTERSLWQQGVRDWDYALACSRPPRGIGAARWSELCARLQASRQSLSRDEHRFFAQTLAPADHWRAWPHFRGRTAYLDIETTGTGPWAQVTVVGIWDGHRQRTYVAGDNLEAFAEEVEQYALLVTFNGATFDLPFLRRRFHDLPADQLHVDLRYALGRLGLGGGLKRIERRLGLRRSDDLEGLSGEDAVRLWAEHRAGSEQALETLVRYNAADVQNLEPLMQWAYERLVRLTWGPESERGEPGVCRDDDAL